jgi:hypothetical protein
MDDSYTVGIKTRLNDLIAFAFNPENVPLDEDGPLLVSDSPSNAVEAEVVATLLYMTLDNGVMQWLTDDDDE